MVLQVLRHRAVRLLRRNRWCLPCAETNRATTPNLWGVTHRGSFVRVYFKIWPGHGSLIETTFRQEVIKAMRVLGPKDSSWQVPVTYRAGTLSSHPTNRSKVFPERPDCLGPVHRRREQNEACGRLDAPR